MLYWRREAVRGTGRGGGCGGGGGRGVLWTQEKESEIGHGGGVKSLLCMCAIQEDGQLRGGVHNSLISARLVLPEPLFSHEEEEEGEEDEEEEKEVAACWLTLCAAALWAMLLPVSRQPVV